MVSGDRPACVARSGGGQRDAHDEPVSALAVFARFVGAHLLVGPFGPPLPCSSSHHRE
jgi:hypothetical protein